MVVAEDILKEFGAFSIGITFSGNVDSILCLSGWVNCGRLGKGGVDWFSGKITGISSNLLSSGFEYVVEAWWDDEFAGDRWEGLGKMGGGIGDKSGLLELMFDEDIEGMLGEDMIRELFILRSSFDIGLKPPSPIPPNLPILWKSDEVDEKFGFTDTGRGAMGGAVDEDGIENDDVLMIPLVDLSKIAVVVLLLASDTNGTLMDV